MSKTKKTVKKLREMETFLQKELHRYDRFEERQQGEKASDNPLLRGFRDGLLYRRAEAARNLQDVTEAIEQLKTDSADQSAGKRGKKGAKDDASPSADATSGHD